MTTKIIKEKLSKYDITAGQIDTFKCRASGDLWDKFVFQVKLAPEVAVKRFGFYFNKRIK